MCLSVKLIFQDCVETYELNILAEILEIQFESHLSSLVTGHHFVYLPVLPSS